MSASTGIQRVAGQVHLPHRCCKCFAVQVRVVLAAMATSCRQVAEPELQATNEKWVRASGSWPSPPSLHAGAKLEQSCTEGKPPLQ